MRLPFLDRGQELARLKSLFENQSGALGVVYGRRRCGKSRLIQEALAGHNAVYSVGDDRESTLQRAGLAREIGRLIPGFDQVTYPEWDALLSRWLQDAAPGSILALDEFPALVSAARELPSLLQKILDLRPGNQVKLLLCGSSQRMMQGLVLDRTAPLYGRATEIIKLAALPAGWIGTALGLRQPEEAVRSFAVWGGIPRYWELAADHGDRGSAIKALVLSPLGVLHEEPARLLLDDLRELTQAASILALIGQGCHRPSEIAGRLGKPATSLSRPLQRLLELEIIRRETPFGSSARDSKRTLYRIADPYLRFWFRFVEPNRSRLEAGQTGEVMARIERDFSSHAGRVWEDLARESVPRLKIDGRSWMPARRWWGGGLNRRPMEIDIVAESADGMDLLLGEVKWEGSTNVSQLVSDLQERTANFPLAGTRKIRLGLWLKNRPRTIPAGVEVFTPHQVLHALR
jgi:AAA+ ATPase superfamily predicted ATPase